MRENMMQQAMCNQVSSLRRLRPHAETRRARIVSIIQSRPGIRYRELVRITKLAHGTLSHNVRILERQKRIRIRRDGGERFRLCMSCGNNSGDNAGRRFSKRRIAILSTIGVGAAGAAYLSVTVNPAIGAYISVLLAFAACPAMCAAMSVTMWLSRRSSKKKSNGQQMQQEQKTKEEVSNIVESTTEEQQEKLAIAVTETNDERTVSSFEQPQGHRKKKKNSLSVASEV